MDGVFTLCRVTPHCTRLDMHEGSCNVSLKVERRSLASRLRYLAAELERGGNPRAVALQLREIAEGR